MDADTAIRIDGECALAYYYRGMALERKGEIEKAKRDFQMR